MALLVRSGEGGLLTPDDVAVLLRITRWGVYKLVRRGQLGAVRLGPGPCARIRIPGEELRRFILRGASPAARAEWPEWMRLEVEAWDREADALGLPRVPRRRPRR
jgi:excisionase family DNA binding protein